MKKEQINENKKERPTFGQFLTERRMAKGLTQKQLGDMLYVGESAVSKWENDKRRPDLDLITRISEIFGISESELIRACVDTSHVKEKKQARRYKIIANIYNFTLFISFGIALLTCFIVNLAVEKTLSWFFIVLFSIICAGTLLLVPQYIRKNKLVLIPLMWLASLNILLGICCLITGGAWFFITFMALLLAYSIVFAPILIKFYFPKFIKHNALISITIDALILFALLVVIDIYSASTTTGSFGWSMKLGLLSLIFWVAPIYVTILITKYIRTHWTFKTSALILMWIIFSNSFEILLSLLNVNDSDRVMFWEANLSNWSEELINANIMLIINLSALFIATGFINKKKNIK